MPSDLQVDNIKDGSATKTLATLSSSAVTLHSDVTFPTGHVIKTYQNVFKGEQSLTNSGGNHTTAVPDSDYVVVGTGASGANGSPLSITCDAPVSSSSKYLIIATINSSNRNVGFVGFKYFYNNSGVGSDTVLPDASNATGGLQTAGHFGASHNSGGGSDYSTKTSANMYLWSPSSSLAQTIIVKVATYTADDIYINRSVDDGNYSYVFKATSTLTIQEIAG